MKNVTASEKQPIAFEKAGDGMGKRGQNRPFANGEILSNGVCFPTNPIDFASRKETASHVRSSLAVLVSMGSNDFILEVGFRISSFETKE
ncbi:hypothetical protein UM396_17855 [Geobacillus subterraneus]|uniref:hypothetical protein n=1 Tax=Geobacillus subterraneus TaxID=129338 RepID=UPI002AC9D88C|nr:hypothetical protein [Geobacillus subterraneus]WPZ18379.1 hypothetical protein UM396_17855 [Geobacillus subterraneus]